MLLALNKYDKFIYRLFEYLCSKHFHTFVPTTILTLQTNQSLHFVTDVTLLIGYLLLFASSPSKTISSTLKFLSFLFHYNELARLHGFPSSTWSKALLLSGTSIYIFPELLDEASQVLTFLLVTPLSITAIGYEHPIIILVWWILCWLYLLPFTSASSVRSSHQRCSIEKAVLKNFAIFTTKHLCWSLFQ